MSDALYSEVSFILMCPLEGFHLYHTHFVMVGIIMFCIRYYILNIGMIFSLEDELRDHVIQLKELIGVP